MHFRLFDTAIGACAIVWSDGGVVGFLLPEAGETAMRGRVARRFAGALEADAPETPEPVAMAVTGVVAHLEGRLDDLAWVALDQSASPLFNRRVYAITRAIPPGRTLTYGEVAAQLGEPGAAQAVGRALGDNPIPLIVPCHRVLAAGGRLHGFSAPGGIETKRRLLEIEGARAGSEPDLFDPRP